MLNTITLSVSSILSVLSVAFIASRLVNHLTENNINWAFLYALIISVTMLTAIEGALYPSEAFIIFLRALTLLCSCGTTYLTEPPTYSLLSPSNFYTQLTKNGHPKESRGTKSDTSGFFPLSVSLSPH